VEGDFAWEVASKLPEGSEFNADVDGRKWKDEKVRKDNNKDGNDHEPMLPGVASEKEGEEHHTSDMDEDQEPFDLKNLKLNIAKGSFVAIVGRVGSGKVVTSPFFTIIDGVYSWFSLQSSVLQSLVGEMRKTRGEVNRERIFSLNFTLTGLSTECR